MGANLGQKNSIVEGLALCLDAGNASSASIDNTNDLISTGFSATASPENGSGWQRVVAGEYYYVSMNSNGTNRIAYSLDGITWTSQAAVEANWWFGLSYGNGKFVMTARGAVESNAGNEIIQYASESDLSSWTGVTPSEDNNWNSVAYGNGKFVSISDDGTNRVMYASDSNLNSWTLTSAAAQNQWHSVTYGNGKFVAVSPDGTNRVMYASDSDVTTWTSANAAAANSWQCVTYGDGYFVAIAEDGTKRVMYSTNGINWTATYAAGDVKWKTITYGGGYFVAVSQTNASSGGTTANAVMWAKSSNLDSWTYVNIEEQGQWTGIGFKQGRFVACSFNESTNRFAYADIPSVKKLNDISLSKSNLTLTGSPKFDIGSYIELNMGPPIQYCEMPTNRSVIQWGANPYSIEFWVNRYDGYYLMDMRSSTANANPYISFSSGQSNRLGYRVQGEVGMYFSVDTDQPSATDETWTGWRHYIITREGTGSNELKLYYNGSMVSTATDDSTQTVPAGFKLGTRCDNDSASLFKGRIGLFKIYNGNALSAAEVLQNYNSTKGRYGL